MQIVKKYEPLFTLLFLAFSATFGLFSASIYLGTPKDIILAITSASITFMVYCINRYTDTEDNIKDTSSYNFFKQNTFFLFLSIALLLLSIAWLYVTKRFTLFHILIIVIGIAYSVKLIPYISNRKVVYYRLKDICIVKSLCVALVWGPSFFVINWLVYPEKIEYPIKTLLLMLCLSISSFMNTVFCDILDVEGDMTSNIKTIPTHFGLKNTYTYAIFTPGLIFLLFSSIFFAFEIITLKMLLFILCNMAFPIIYILLHKTKNLPKWIITAIADSCYAAFAAGLIVLHFLER